MISHCYILISLLEINFKREINGSNNSAEQYDAMLISMVINAIMIIHKWDLIDVINDKILFMHCVIATVSLLDYGIQYCLLLMKIQNMLPHIAINLSDIHTILYRYECAVYYILNNDKSDAGGGGDDSYANTDGIADAGIVLSSNGMELWLDQSDESTMIKQVNDSTSADKVSVWFSKTDNINKHCLCLSKYIPNTKSQLKLYLVIASIQTARSFHVFNHYPRSEHDNTFAFHTNGTIKGVTINTDASCGDFHYNTAHTNLLNGRLSINNYDDVVFKHVIQKILVLECT